MSGDDDVVHRGVRWQRATSGAMRWWDDDSGGWVRYQRGGDAPPRPPGWERRWRSAGLRLSIERPSWRSPYRIVPLALLAAIVVLGVSQAVHGSGGQVGAESRAASKLAGRCLAAGPAVSGHPASGPLAVACSATGATMRVTEVLAGTPGAPGCPPGTNTVVLGYAGVPYPHHLCVVPNAPGGATGQAG